MKIRISDLAIACAIIILLFPLSVAASVPTIHQIVADFTSVFGRRPTHQEQEYWKSRRDDKETRQGLVGAMRYHRGLGKTIGNAPGGASAPRTSTVVPTIHQIVTLFREVFGRLPSHDEQEYWKMRRTDKPNISELRGAMSHHRAQGITIDRNLTPERVASLGRNRLIADVLPIFVQIYGNDPTQAERQWWRQRISCGEIANRDALIVSMAYHRFNGARMGRATICGQAEGIVRGTVNGLKNHPMGPHVRVGLYSTNGSAIHVTSNGRFQVRDGHTNILKTMNAGEVVRVSWSDGRYRIQGPGINTTTSREVRLVPLNMAIMELKGFSDDASVVPFASQYNRFRGVIAVRKCEPYTNSNGRTFQCNQGSHGGNSLWAINELRVEYYLRGLAETSGTGPVEYLKALGTAARTYALYHLIVTGGRYPAEGFDMTNTPNDQLYRGYDYEVLTRRMSGIFADTKGTVIVDNNHNLRVPVYFSDSDGRTRAFPDPHPRFSHLHHSVKDPHSQGRECGVGGNHCYGMSAQGAFGFAQNDGWDFKRILQYYYRGIRLIVGY